MGLVHVTDPLVLDRPEMLIMFDELNQLVRHTKVSVQLIYKRAGHHYEGSLLCASSTHLEPKVAHQKL